MAERIRTGTEYLCRKGLVVGRHMSDDIPLNEDLEAVTI